MVSRASRAVGVAVGVEGSNFERPRRKVLEAPDDMNSLLHPSPEVNEKRSGQHTGALSVVLEAQGRLYKASVRGGASRGGGRRGVVCGLSRAARKRMLEAMARVNWAIALLTGGLTFVTLTYHDRWPEDPRAQWTQVQRWARMMGFTWGLWRREFQQRGAPHWHLLIAGPYSRSEVLRTWRAVTGDYDIKIGRAHV